MHQISRSQSSPHLSSGPRCHWPCGRTVPRAFTPTCLQFPNQKGGIYPIIDLKAINVFIQSQKFHIETIRFFIAYLHQEWLLWTLKTQTCMAPSSLCISISYTLFWVPWTTSLWPCHSAPWAFTKVLAQVLGLLCSHGILIVGYFATSCWGKSRHRLCWKIGLWLCKCNNHLIGYWTFRNCC